MKKFLKWASIGIGIILVILIIGIIALPFVFPLEKIKNFAAAKISESIHREVKIEKVSFDIFSGIKLQGLSVGNRTGFAKKPFISANAIELRYAFWPLFSRQVIIKEIRLVRPEILIEKNVHGEFNFSDLTQPKVKSTNENEKRKRDVTDTDKRPTKPPFNLFISSFSIKDGKITYADYSTKTSSEIKNLNVKVSGFELALIKPIEVKMSATVTYQGKEIPLALAGKAGVNLEKETVSVSPLSFSIAGESAAASVAVSNWKKAPHLDLSISSKKLSVDPLLAIFAAPAPPEVKKPKAKPGELTKTVDKATAAIPKNVSLSGDINLENLTFQKFKADKINLSLALSGKKVSANLKEIRIYDGVLSGKAKVDLATSGLSYDLQNIKLAGFNSTLFVNAMAETFLAMLPDYKDLLNKVYGVLDVSVSLKGRGVEPQDILANAAGEGSFSLKGGELKRLKTLAAIGQTIKSNTLQQDLKFRDLYAAFSIKNRIVSTKDLRLEDSGIKAAFNGGVDLGKLIWTPGNRLTLKLSPSLTKDLPKEFSVFRDNQGWLELTFEITGSLKMPIPKPILEKPLEAAVGKLKAKIEAKKVEIEEKAKAELASKEAEAQKALEAEKARLAEEAKAKAAEEAKKQLKNLLKF